MLLEMTCKHLKLRFAPFNYWDGESAYALDEYPHLLLVWTGNSKSTSLP